MNQTELEPGGDVLGEALTEACRAPSLHNSQPWIWTRRHDALYLLADDRRRLSVTDPTGRQLLISCGAALHHLRIAMTARGWSTRVDRFPDPSNRLLLAAIRFRFGASVGARDHDLAEALRSRRSDRRPFVDGRIPEAVISEMASAARENGADLIVIDRAEVPERIFDGFRRAARQHDGDEAYRAEMSSWTDPARTVDGVPRSSIPTPRTVRSTPLRGNFGPGVLEAPVPGDDGASIVVIRTPTQSIRDSLRAGESLSAVLLEATRLGYATCPLTHATEGHLPLGDWYEDLRLASITVARAVETVARTPGELQVLVRIGIAPGVHPGCATARRPLDEVLRTVG